MLHPVAPVVSLNFPLVQSLQEEAAATLLYVPAAQLTHWVAAEWADAAVAASVR